MKLFATLKNERGTKKTTSDDTRIEVELVYKNRIIGTVGLYAIHSDKGYRVTYSTTNGRGFNAHTCDVIDEEESE